MVSPPKGGRGWRRADELWQAAEMANPSPTAAGAPLALCVLAGAIIGATQHQAMLGVLIGLAGGIAIAVAVWLRDRGKIGH